MENGLERDGDGETGTGTGKATDALAGGDESEQGRRRTVMGWISILRLPMVAVGAAAVVVVVWRKGTVWCTAEPGYKKRCSVRSVACGVVWSSSAVEQ